MTTPFTESTAMPVTLPDHSELNQGGLNASIAHGILPAANTMTTPGVTAGESLKTFGFPEALGIGRIRGGIKRTKLATITTQLAIMSRTGVDIATALESLSRQAANPVEQRILSDIHIRVVGGQSLSESLGCHTNSFDEAYRATVAAGEASGQLPESLNQLARLIRNEIRLRASVRGMLAYPVILMSVSSFVVFGLLTFVLPTFAEVFGRFDMPLPWITECFIRTGGLFRKFLWIWTSLALLLSIFAAMFLQSSEGKKVWDGFVLNLIGLKQTIRFLLIGRICRLMGIMISSGVPLLDAVKLTSRSVKNSRYQEIFRQIETSVMNGHGMSQVLLDSEFIPRSAAEMLSTAERTGSLATVTEMIGEHFEEQGELSLREAMQYIEPLITIVMGLMVAAIVMSVMLPLFDISTLRR